jgi:hypothetical protein
MPVRLEGEALQDLYIGNALAFCRAHQHELHDGLTPEGVVAAGASIHLDFENQQLHDQAPELAAFIDAFYPGRRAKPLSIDYRIKHHEYSPYPDIKEVGFSVTSKPERYFTEDEERSAYQLLYLPIQSMMISRQPLFLIQTTQTQVVYGAFPVEPSIGSLAQWARQAPLLYMQSFDHALFWKAAGLIPKAQTLNLLYSPPNA